MLKKSIFLLFLLGILATVGCTKEQLVEPTGVNKVMRGGEDGTVDHGGDTITDDEDDEGDSERDRTSN